MAAEIKDSLPPGVDPNNTMKLQLLRKIDSCEDNINMAILIQNEDGLISISDDKTIRIWLKRDTGQYWPSICHNLPAIPTCLEYEHVTHKLFIGMENGTISEYKVSEDYNSLKQERDYLAHILKVTSVQFSPTDNWLLSCSRDKNFQWHCTQTGRRLGGYVTNAWCTCLQYDTQAKYAFVGDYAGNVSLLKLTSNEGLELVTTLKGHSGSICCLCWDSQKQLLFSGSFDQSIVVWDIGGQKGTAFELQGHREKVQSVVYIPESKVLVSASDDCTIGIWDLKVQRNECPEWAESNDCQKCDRPFFWNFKSMWQQKTLGGRQHHCRKCGLAFCDSCSTRRTTIPLLGFEYAVRICDRCDESISDSDKKPLAFFHDSRHHIVNASYSSRTKMLLTVGKDKIMKLWDMKPVLN
ncbi:DgyrCDS2819 [Dimorphilus gyrociliatus]|uniref:DgyrCDS2819 n=1 Tax=Dimorphilus gyrociliatus TaxID=2664684 RepID=A0A7I8VEG0_9ANNE|nr:DgyrCDS2819 [Dimorphilus gyrociliatus]